MPATATTAGSCSRTNRRSASAAGTEFRCGQFRCLRGGSPDDVGDPDPAVDEVLPVGVVHAGASVDLTVDDPAAEQRRVEAVAGMGEMGLRSRRSTDPG